MPATFGGQGNWGGGSSIGGGGNMSGQEMRGSGGSSGLLGTGRGGSGATVGGMAQMQMQRREQDRLRQMLKEMGIDIDALEGGTPGGGQQPSTQPASWAFPQYTQGWLPPSPAVPPMVPTPPFKRS